jgi:DNA-binding winged helix-turn-helix (wHTH) protein
MSIEPGKSAERDGGDFDAFGPFRLFPMARRLERNGEPVELGGRALDILVALVAHAGQVVSKTDLMASIWPDTTVVEGVVRTHVCGLRKALGDSVNGAGYITSVAGRGYCFVAPVIRGAVESKAASSREGIPVARTDRNVEHGLPPRLARMAGRDQTVRTIGAELVPDQAQRNRASAGS